MYMLLVKMFCVSDFAMATRLNFFVHFFWCMVICEYRTESNPLAIPLLVFGLKIKNGHRLNVAFMQIAMVQLRIIPIPTCIEYVCNSKHLASSVK